MTASPHSAAAPAKLPTALLSTRLAAANLLLPLRLIVGWTYFSAFWRRVVLDNKLLPDQPGYIGEKFNHFLPNALGIDPLIEYFVSHPELLWWKLVAFTIVEGVVGLALMAGFMTRLMGLATSGLALGILLGAGWLGTTCLDEWQIGILGIGSGLAFAFAGGGSLSVDHLLHKRWGPGRSRWLSWTRSLDTPESLDKPWVYSGVAIACLGLTLLTNQVFHGGVWGNLHNKSVRPVVELSDAAVRDGALSVQFYRVEGADVYGSFAIGLKVKNEADEVVAEWSAEQLAELSTQDIHNHYVARVKPGEHSLIIPLGAKADVQFRASQLENLPPGAYQVELLDISGAQWETTLNVSPQTSTS